MCEGNVMSDVIDIVGTTDATVAIVWADGTYTIEAGTFIGGRVEAEAAVAALEALEELES
jgi:hypothetical protein